MECVHITCCCKLLSFRTFSKAFQRQTYIHIDRLIFVCVLFTHKHTHTHVQMCSFTHLRGISNYICMYVFAASVATPESYSQKLAGHMHTYIHTYMHTYIHIYAGVCLATFDCSSDRRAYTHAYKCIYRENTFE